MRAYKQVSLHSFLSISPHPLSSCRQLTLQHLRKRIYWSWPKNDFCFVFWVAFRVPLPKRQVCFQEFRGVRSWQDLTRLMKFHKAMSVLFNCWTKVSHKHLEFVFFQRISFPSWRFLAALHRTNPLNRTNNPKCSKQRTQNVTTVSMFPIIVYTVGPLSEALWREMLKKVTRLVKTRQMNSSHRSTVELRCACTFVSFLLLIISGWNAGLGNFNPWKGRQVKEKQMHLVRKMWKTELTLEKRSYLLDENSLHKGILKW